MTPIVPELTPLQRRLAYVRDHADVDWVMGIENVPEWSKLPVLSTPRDRPWLYESTQGAPDLIKRVVRRERAFGKGWCSDENILITNGGFNALGMYFRHMHRIGYRVVICQAPVLRSVFDLIRSSYLRPILASVDEASTLLHAHPKSTAVVYLCSPQNPTGAVLHVDDVGSLIADVQRTASAVVIDSVYDSYCFTRSLDVRDYGRLPPASVTFVNSMSKNYGAPGIRIGWLVGNSDLIGQLIVRQEYESIAVNGLGQAAAIDLLDAGNSELIARVADGRSQVQDWWLARGNYPELRIDGGTQAALPVLASTDPEKLADDLMLRHDVVVSSSANYRGVSYPFLRLPLGVPRARLDTILSAYDQVHQE